jgi:hypothetical protein
MNSTTQIKHQLSQVQYQKLKDFFFCCWLKYHYQIKAEFSYWMVALDKLQVPWHVQNITAMLAETRENNGFYLKTLLSRHNIGIEL